MVLRDHPAALPGRVTPRDVAWLAGRSVTPAEAEVCGAHLRRHRNHRAVGGAFGVLLALVVGWRVHGQIGFVVGDLTPLADVLYCGVAGTAAGALAAERVRLRTGPGHRMVASLAPRADLPGARTVRAARVVLGAAAVAAVALGLAGGRWGATLAVALGLVVAVLAEATRAAATGRPRPVLSAAAAELDTRMRGLAATGAARLELAVAVLVVAWLPSAVPLGEPAWPTRGGPGFVGLVTVMAAAVLAAALLVRSATPRPPRRWAAP